ncbi:MAG: 50S ribosomal protein L22 [Sporocytophaga sp.]|uniref:50S ribosomal protein L22 n=1 Tax=Sporocytophaga sp. TaxID=2231183 RepID=UPI001B171D7C|nr:50S ribosomal protein L22 [Sporocytophaga sp.]MBO9699638.1 50S ribosomal protein L22 [Sporocytophaga sp.]
MEAAVKQRRSVVKKKKKEAALKASFDGSVVAKLRNVPTSPRKMRLVADLVRGIKANAALALLKYQPQSGAKKIEKLLLSAISDWQIKYPNERLEDADLVVKDIFVDGGRILKRLRPAPQGRAHRVRKRSNHITLVLASLNGVAAPATEVKKEETKSKSVEGEKKEAKAKSPKAKTAAKTEVKKATKKSEK